MSLNSYLATQGVIPANDPNSGDFPGNTRLVWNKDTNGVLDGTYQVQIRLWNPGGNLTKNGVYMLGENGLDGKSPAASGAIASSGISHEIVVATAATSGSTWDWFACFGECDCLVNAASPNIAKNDYLKLVPGTAATKLVQDGIPETTSSVASARAAATTDGATIRVKLFGEKRVLNT